MTSTIIDKKRILQPLWRPDTETASRANLTRFMREIEQRYAIKLPDYWALDRWAVENPEHFWEFLFTFANVIAESRGNVTLQDGERMLGASWFPRARLNFAENLLRRRDAATALVFWGEDKVQRSLSFAELYGSVSRLSQAFRSLGIGPGDRVAGFLPNMPEAVIAMLATASLGAVWSSCSPDFGVQGVLDRFGQIGPKILIGVDGYYYSGKAHETLSRLAEIEARLPSLTKLLVVPYVEDRPDISGFSNAIIFDDAMAQYAEAEIEFAQFPFNHPLYVMFSSGTTGVPKCIVHGAGGTLLQHLKEHVLHVDVYPGDRLFYFTTCGWMMWNWLVSGLAAGASLLLYDGSPFVREGHILFDYADAEEMTIFGTSPKYLAALAKQGLSPVATHWLTKLRTVLCTGSPLAPEQYDYVYRNIKESVRLSSISGGTDIISCFVLGNPLLPVYRGEIQCRGLGMKVEIYDDDGRAVRSEKGELVCSAPFPSMPLGFWNDPTGGRYREAYFDRFPNVWCHGDYAELTPRNGYIVHGRSDAVLNPGGVRIGTAEIYRQVEQLDEIVESLVIAQEWENDVRVVLFVRLRDGLILDDGLIERIKVKIRRNATSRHVPAKILQVRDIPRTKSGKIVELAVREIVHGRPVKNLDALANPEALEYFRERKELR